MESRWWPSPSLAHLDARFRYAYGTPDAYLGQTTYRMTEASVINALDQDK